MLVPYLLLALAVIIAVPVIIFTLKKARKQNLQEQALHTEDAGAIQAAHQPTAKESASRFFSYFIPKGAYFITPIIVNLNIAVFIAMVIAGANFFDPDTDILITWGANVRLLVLDGEWWRVLTNVFLHGGVIHLLLNMYALVFIGILLEPVLGKLRFSIAYLLTGITASLCSIYFNPVTISVGASGAIFGLYGVFLAMLTTNFIDKEVRKFILPSIAIFVVYNLGYGFVKGGIDNAAHIGGLVSGILVGYLYYPALKTTATAGRKYVTIALAVAFIMLTSFVIYKNIPDNINKYEVKIVDFAKREEAALRFFKLPASASKSTKLAALKVIGIPNWDLCLKDLDTMKHLNLPEHIQAKNKLLKTYCLIRIKTYALKYKQIEQDTIAPYQDSITRYNIRIATLLDSIKNKSYLNK